MSGPRFPIACVVLVGLGALSFPLAAALPIGHLDLRAPMAPSCSPGLSLNLSATRGTAPLLVSFRLTDVWGSPNAVNWSFGDGTYLAGGGDQYLAPSRLYSAVGVFPVGVALSAGNQSGSCTATVSVVPSPLSVQIAVGPSSGIAPLTVTFSANVSGGSGTYRSATWAFGDGDTATGFNVSYTYRDPGQFTATFTLVDSANQSFRVSAHLAVNASVDPGNRSTVTGSNPNAGLYLGLLAGAGVVLAGILFWRFARRPSRASRSPPESESPPAPVVDTSPDREFSPGGSSLATELGTPGWPGPGSSIPPPKPTFLEEVPSPPTEPERGSPILPPVSEALATAPEPPSSGPRLKLSQRVLLHLFLQGHLADGEVASQGFTQGGMAEQLAVAQSPLSSVLRRLVVAGLVVQDTRHVRGEARRLRVYRLTPLGESLARDLYRRGTPTRSEDSPAVDRGL